MTTIYIDVVKTKTLVCAFVFGFSHICKKQTFLMTYIIYGVGVPSCAFHGEFQN